MNFRRGFTLTETLLSVSLLGVFMLLAFRLVHANFFIAGKTLAASAATARFDNALHQLREDILQSKSLDMPRPGLLRIHGPDDQLIDWQNDHATLSRDVQKETRSWDLGRPVSLKLDGQVVLLSANPSDEIAMARLPGGGLR